MKEEWAEFEIRGPVYQLATEISHKILTYSKPDITASFFPSHTQFVLPAVPRDVSHI